MRPVAAFCIFFVLFLSSSLYSQSEGDESHLHALTRTVIDFGQPGPVTFSDGFAERVSGQVITYHSALPEVTEALITRATDGKMKIEWSTGHLNLSRETTLVWLAGLGANLGSNTFDLFINDAYFCSFTSSAKSSWTVKARQGGSLSFVASYADNVGDLFGVMILNLPAGRFQGESLRLSVTGRAENSNAWYMTNLAGPIAAALQKTRDSGFWYRLIAEAGNYRLELPGTWLPKKIRAGEGQPLVLSSENGLSVSRFSKDLLSKKAIPLIKDDQPVDLLRAPRAENAGMEIFDDNRIIYRSYQEIDGRPSLEVSAGYVSQLAREITELSSMGLGDGKLELITSSHQDIAWIDNPQACKIMRDTMIITPAIELLRTNPDYRYSAEQALMLEEYLQRHPERLPELQSYSAAGRLEWGASYNQPYEGMYHGESLIRQFYAGRRWLKKVLPGYDPKVYFNVDVPGRTLQMAQIAKKSGVDFMIISRFEEGYYYRESPDGSRLAVHSPGHYHHASEFLRRPAGVTVMQTPRHIADMAREFEQYHFPHHFPMLMSSDMSRPRDLGKVFQIWAGLRIKSAGNQETEPLKLPQWRYNTFQPVMEQLFSQGKDIPVVKGERPNVWLYIHGPTHHRAISASRQAGRLLPQAETFQAINAVLRNDWSSYPQQQFDKAWRAQIYPDHGWGGKDGQVTDQLFLDKSEFARDQADELLTASLNSIAAAIQTDDKKGTGLIVFNSLAHKRSAFVSARVNPERGRYRNIVLTGPDGRLVQSTVRTIDRYNDGTVREALLEFWAEALPSVGYKTFYLKDGSPGTTSWNRTLQGETTVFENQHYRITFGRGGIRQIHDKQLNTDLVNPEKFLFGELIALQSVGNGAGEFADVQQPTSEYFEKMSQYKPSWRQMENNDLYSRFQLRQKLNNSTVQLTVTVYNPQKRIDFDVDVLGWDGTHYREYRLAFPLKQSAPQITYEVPFGTVTVGRDELQGAAGERYTRDCRLVHPREVLDWISSSDRNTGVTFSSDVAVWDYIDPVDDPANYPVLQPVLLASRRSCHGLGNWYLQKGDHHYSFSMTSHQPGWQNGYHFGREINHAPRTVVKTGQGGNGSLPQELSFLSLSAENVLLSTLKKAEDENGLVLRLCETEGRDTDVQVRWFENLNGVWQTNAIEEGGRALKVQGENVSVQMGHHAIETLKMRQE